MISPIKQNILSMKQGVLCELFNFNQPENVILQNITESMNVLIKGLLKMEIM